MANLVTCTLLSSRRWGRLLLWSSWLVLGAAIATPLVAAPDDVVNVLDWSNNIDTRAIPSFEQQTGVHVNYDLMDSNDVLEGRLLAGRSGYDVVLPSADYLPKQIEAGLYQPIPKARLKHYGNLDAVLMAQLSALDPGNVYGVPYTWGTTGVGFNVAAITARMPDAPLDSWKLIFDPTVVSRFKDCGVAIVDAGDTVVEAALIYLGRNPNSEDLVDLTAAADAIAKIQPYVRYFQSTSYIDDLANGEVCLALGWSGDFYQARQGARNGVDLEYTVPKEGALLWVLVMAIPIDAPHPDAAAKWIDHVLDPTVMAGISNAIFYANANRASTSLLDATVRGNPMIYPPDDVMRRLVAERSKSQTFVRARNRLWTQAKGGG